LQCSLSAFLTEEGFDPESLGSYREISLEDGAITKSHLILKATVKDIEQTKFDALVKKAKENVLFPNYWIPKFL
jgi:lipoyl-dependent peroxiredoxin